MSRINVKIKAQQETEINGQGPHIDAQALEALFQKLDLLQKDDVLILAGSIPSSMPEDSYEQIMKRMDGKGILTVVDATKKLLVNVLKYHPFLVKPNNHELGEIFQTVLKTSDEIVEAAKKITANGSQKCVDFHGWGWSNPGSGKWRNSSNRSTKGNRSKFRRSRRLYGSWIYGWIFGKE